MTAKSQKATAGLTIIEVLISVTLLGVLATAILAPLTGLFKMTGQSAQTLNATTQAQEIMEYVQGQWRSYPAMRDPLDPDEQDQRNDAATRRSRSRYARTCLENFPNIRDGLTVSLSVQNLDSNANVTGTSNERRRETCGNASIIGSPAMKRVTVNVTMTNDPDNSASLTADIPRP